MFVSLGLWTVLNGVPHLNNIIFFKNSIAKGKIQQVEALEGKKNLACPEKQTRWDKNQPSTLKEQYCWKFSVDVSGMGGCYWPYEAIVS